MKVRYHPSYKELEKRWKFLQLSYRGGDPYILFPGMLTKHRFEHDDDYKARLERAYYLNSCKPIVDTYTDFISGGELSRTAEKTNQVAFEAFRVDCDGRGTPLQVFMRKVTTQRAVYGKVGVLSMGPDPMDIPLVVTRMAENKLPPRLRIIPPLNLLDWSLNRKGAFDWIFFCYVSHNDSNPEVERKSQTVYELWNRRGWIRYQKKDSENSDDQALVPVASGVHNLGTVPYTEFTFGDSDLDGSPEPLIEDISILGRSVFNWCSLLDEIHYLQAFSQLTVAGDAEDIDEQVIGTNRIFNYPPDSPYPPSYISPDASQAKLIMDNIQIAIAEQYRMAVLQKRSTSKSQDYATAFGRMVDFEDTENVFKGQALLMEKDEVQLASTVNLWRGKKGPFWTPVYPKTFEVRSFAQMIEDAINLEVLNLGNTLMTEVKWGIARRAIPQAVSGTMDKVRKEIEQGVKSSRLRERDGHQMTRLSGPAATADNPPNNQNPGTA